MPIGERSLGLLRGFGQRAKPYLIPLALSSVLAFIAIRAILDRAGRPALPLDDSFIHLQFARRFAEGHPMTFSNGGGVSSGATSFLWPLLLAPFALFGMHGLTLVYAAWGLGTFFHAALILETSRLTEPLAGRAAAIAAGAMCLLFGAFTWFAWSGMETIAFTWALVRTARVASEWLETKPHERTLRGALGLALIGAATALFRPEGALASGGAFVALVIAVPELSRSRSRLATGAIARLPALITVLGVVLVPTLNLALTGHARSATAIVKWHIGNPYLEGWRLIGAIGNNVKMLLTELLAGGPYTTIFLPEDAHYLFAAGFLALLVSVFRKRTTARALAVMLIVLGTLMPCTFSTILWNRVRYIWPFAPGWFILVVCLGKEVGGLVERVVKGGEHLAVIVPAIFAGALGVKLSWSISDLATSARAIDHQQVTLGLWAADNLPKDARIGVNDTGAIAYFSGRKTFDVVGLTTESEARYFVEGAGSRYEHYERMPISDLPTHFIVYPEWMGVDPILGEELTRATVTDQSILGGATAVAFEARYDVLGRASLPMSASHNAPMFADMDVSDLESEAEHNYIVGISYKEQNQVFSIWDDDGKVLADGGRVKRFADRFNVKLDPARPVRMVMRVGAEEAMSLVVSAGGNEVGHVEVPLGSWNELELVIPGDHVDATTAIRVESADPTLRFTSMHYWFFAIPQ